jgi:uncharacterized membrane protein
VNLEVTMAPALTLTGLWLVFAGTHIGLATGRVRAALVARLGEWGFLGLFSTVAALAFTAMVRFYAAHRLEGAAGPALGATGVPRVLLLALVVAGAVLALASLGPYPASAYAIGKDGAHEACGLERITRHPFFAGVGLAFGAHALLAPHLIGTVFCAGLAVLALAGAWHQDRKLLARRGPSFAAFLSSTSLVPFAAILSGRQRLVLRELPWTSLAAAVPAIIFLRWAHGSLFARGGVWVIVTVVGGAAVLMLQDWRMARRRARRSAPVPGAAASHAG